MKAKVPTISVLHQGIHSCSRFQYLFDNLFGRVAAGPLFGVPVLRMMRFPCSKISIRMASSVISVFLISIIICNKRNVILIKNVSAKVVNLCFPAMRRAIFGYFTYKF